LFLFICEIRESKCKKRAKLIVSDQEIIFKDETFYFFCSRNLQMCLRLSFQVITNKYIAQNSITFAIIYYVSIWIKILNLNDIQVIIVLNQFISSIIDRRTKCQSKRVVIRTFVCCIIINKNRIYCDARRITRWAQYLLTIFICFIKIKFRYRKKL